MRALWIALLFLAPAVGQSGNGADATHTEVAFGNVTTSWVASPANTIHWTLDDGKQNVTNVTLRFDALVEFEDLDGDGAFSLGDAVVQQRRFTDLQGPSHTRQEDGFELSWGLSAGTLQRVTARFTISEGATLDATSAALRVTAQFPFQEADSRLALLLRLTPVGRFHDGDLQWEALPLFPTVSWGTGSVDGGTNQTAPTLQTYGTEPATGRLLVLALPQGTTISWDADLGFTQPPKTFAPANAKPSPTSVPLVIRDSFIDWQLLVFVGLLVAVLLLANRGMGKGKR